MSMAIKRFKQVGLTDKQFAKIKSEAADRGVSQSEVVRLAVDAYFESPSGIGSEKAGDVSAGDVEGADPGGAGLLGLDWDVARKRLRGASAGPRREDLARRVRAGERSAELHAAIMELE